MERAELTPARSPLRRARTIADTSHGLPSNQVHKIAHDRQGRLWLSGPSGLSRFDGAVTYTYDKRNGIRCSGLRSVAVGENGTIWLGTDQGLEAVDQDGKPLPWMEWFSWSLGLSECLVAAGNSVWVGGPRGVVRVDVASGASGAQVAFHAEIGFVRDLVRIDDRHLFAASETQGLIEIDGVSWLRVQHAELSGRRILRLAYGEQRELLIGTDAGVFLLDVATRQLSKLPNLPVSQEAVTALASGEKEWWVALGRTIVSIPFRVNEAAQVETYSVDGRSNDLHLDQYGNVWIATDTAGLALLSCLRRGLHAVDLAGVSAVFAVKQVGDGQYCVGGENQLTRLDLDKYSKRAREHTLPVLPATTVWDTHEDHSGLWAATQAGLFHSTAGAAFVRLFSNDTVLSAPTRVFAARGDELWVGTLLGLSRIQHGQATEMRCKEGESLGYVYAMMVDEQSRLWIATLGRGLWCEDGTLHSIADASGPLSPHGNTYTVSDGPDNELAVLQDERIILVDKSTHKARMIAENYPISGWACVWLDEYTLAIGSSDGLRLVDIRRGVVTLALRSMWTARDWEFANNRTLVRLNKDRVLCGISGGLIVVDLAALRPLLTPPTVALSHLQWQGVTPEKAEKGFKVRTGTWSLQVNAFSTWYVDRETLRFRFKLVGFDDAWSALRNTPFKAYNSLPPGQYQVVAQAHSPLNGFGEPTVLCEINVVAPWWAAGFATPLAAAELAYDRIVLSPTRNRVLRERNNALEAEINERTLALRTANEELQRARLEMESRSLTDELTQLPNRRFFDTQLRKEIARAQRLRTSLSLFIFDIDHFKSINDRFGHQAGDIFLRMVAKTLKTHLRGDSDSCARYGGEEFAVVMPDSSAQEALVAAERIRIAVEKLGSRIDAHTTVHATISGGIATVEAGVIETDEALIARADIALYQAKNGGRNCIHIAQGLVGTVEDGLHGMNDG
jgi:diguanylate cyclase (GGDEF)-like protein